MKPRLYLETTVPSYLTARPSRDLTLAAYQQVTREWWATRSEFDLFVSRLVIQECQAGDPQAAADRLAALAGIPLMDQDENATALANALVKAVPMAKRASADALHVAIAAINGADYLITWNCTHIANPRHRLRIEATCRKFACDPPIICTPFEILGNVP